jgi:hypothetical protein
MRHWRSWLITQIASGAGTPSNSAIQLSICAVTPRACGEVPRFCVVSGRRFLGLRPRVENWEVLLPEGFELPEWKDPEFRRGGGTCYSMRLRGRLGPKGRFAHMGICERQLHVSKVIAHAKTDMPGPTW